MTTIKPFVHFIQTEDAAGNTPASTLTTTPPTICKDGRPCVWATWATNSCSAPNYSCIKCGEML